MNFVRNASIISTAALLTIGAAGFAGAQNKNSNQEDCIESQNCPAREMRRSGEEEQDYSGKRRYGANQSDREDQVLEFRRKRRIQEDVNKNEGQLSEEQTGNRSKHAQSERRFDTNKHERSREKDNRFRFEFDGYWYPQPYWYGYGYSMNYGISCRDGRELLLDRGFRRVRTIECQGRTFTYVGRRHGATFRVLVNSRTGRITGVRPV